MNDVRIVKHGPDQGVYINGVRLPGVLKIEPDLFGTDGIPVARVTLAISHFAFEREPPKPAA